MSNKYEATFHPGEPLPKRDPFATLASFDRTARPVRPAVPPVDSDEGYASPGRPPWAEQEQAPLWPLYLIIVLAVATLCGLMSAFVISM